MTWYDVVPWLRIDQLLALDLSKLDLDAHLGLPASVDFDLSAAMRAAAAITTTPTSAHFDLPTLPQHDDLLDLDLNDIDTLLQSTDGILADQHLLERTPLASPIGMDSFEDLLKDLDFNAALASPTTAVNLAAPDLDNQTCPEAFRPCKPTKRKAAKRTSKARSVASSEDSELTVAGTLRKRRKKVAVAEHLKDEAYLDYRRKNNERAKRSREAKRLELLAEKNKLTELNDVHVGLQDEAAALRNALSELVVELEQRVKASYGDEVPADMQALLQTMAQSARQLHSDQ
jgi:hypothetical protein